MNRIRHDLRAPQPADAARRLAGLRAEHLDNSIRFEEYCYHAATLYLELEKPLRAQRLLKRLDAGYAPVICLPPVSALLERATGRASFPYPLCSVNMIARDEEKNIGAALDSIDAIADEIVVCDTGSVDATVRIAALYGARIIDAPWTGSFSDARNRAIAASTGDWIFWMDADDRLDASCAADCVRVWRTARPHAAQFCIVNNRPDGTSPRFLQARLFPRRQGVRFERRVHEQVVISALRAGFPLVNHENIRINHAGYADGPSLRVKARRNLPMIEADLADNPGDPVLLIEHGDCHALLGDYPRAIAAYRAVIDNERNFFRQSDVFIQAHYQLAQVCRANHDGTEAKRHLLRCLYLDPQHIAAALLLGELYLDEHDLKRAFYFFVKAAQESAPVRTTAMDAAGIKMKAIARLAEIMLEWKKFKEAEELLTNALTLYPETMDFYSQMGRAIMGQGRPVDAAWYFGYSAKICPAGNPVAYQGLASIYIAISDLRKTADILTQALENNSASPEIYALLGNVLFELNDPARALDAFEHVLDSEALRVSEALLWRATSCALDVLDIPRAKTLLGRILDRNPDDHKAQEVFQKIEAQATGA
jgi:glycosyltransferase involved in cell wall biosynthesis